MIYIYDPLQSTTGLALVAAVKGKLLRFHDGLNFVSKGKPISFQKDDLIICWGRHVPQVAGVSMLNSNLEHVTQLQVNRHLINVVHNIVATPMQKEGIFTKSPLVATRLLRYPNITIYHDDLLTLRDGNLGKLTYGPYKEFPGWGSERVYSFSDSYKLYLFNGKCVYSEKWLAVKRRNRTDKLYVYEPVAAVLPELAEPFKKIMLGLKLDFGVITVGVYKNNIIIRKVITAPELSTDTIQMYADLFKGYAKGIDDVQKELGSI